MHPSAPIQTTRHEGGQPASPTRPSAPCAPALTHPHLRALNPDNALTLFFDGNCPFCHSEMKRLASWNHAGHLAFVDIAEPGFDPAPLGVSMADLNREMHSQRADGTLLVGIDSLLAAYSLAGKSWLVLPLRIHWLRPALRRLYRGFALRRYAISRWLGYTIPPQSSNGTCTSKLCAVGNPFLGKQDNP